MASINNPADSAWLADAKRVASENYFVLRESGQPTAFFRGELRIAQQAFTRFSSSEGTYDDFVEGVVALYSTN